MKTKVIASTKPGYELPVKEAIKFSGIEAGICYLPDTIDTLLSEDEEKTFKRANGTMKSGHHSVFGHSSYNLILEEVPKILAVLLNNEKDYNTSEKSARYTKMKPSKDEEELYEKWLNLYNKRICEVYPQIEEKQAMKLAQENARYLISVFTPATTMGYTVDLRQLNYLLHWSEDFISNEADTEFNKLLKPVLKDFVENLKSFYVDEINTEAKEREFSLFAKRTRAEEWGETYSTNYYATFAQLAQAQRHRTLYYEISLLEEPKFYVPNIILGTQLQEEWLKDISSLAAMFPQGMFVHVNERGTAEKFIEKCQERLCGCAQLEIALQTKETLDKYLENTKGKNEEVYKYLSTYAKGARCTFPGYKCAKPCIWGAKRALTRNI